MKKKRLNKVLNIVVTLMAAIALMLGNVTSVAAYTDITGYPINFHDADIAFYQSGSALPVKGLKAYFNAATNSYSFDDETESNLINNCNLIYFYSNYNNFIFPCDVSNYDYYLVGTFASLVGADSSLYTFSPNSLYAYTYDENRVRQDLNVSDVNFYDYNNLNYKGFSFSAKVDFSQYSTLCGFDLSANPGNFLTTRTDVSISVVPVKKNAGSDSVMNSILQQLIQINQNLVTSNTLQQTTIDAINTNTTNTSNWFTTLITTLQGWYNTQTENLRTWFYMIEERMSAGFTALYHQMTKEQDEKLNGYDDTTQSDAADNFNTESDKLTQLEDQLNDQSHGFVSDYTTTGFNTGVLTTLSSSLIFVTTWFANFWNMGGIFTAGLNLCFSLSIVFFILRLRR